MIFQNNFMKLIVKGNTVEIYESGDYLVGKEWYKIWKLKNSLI